MVAGEGLVLYLALHFFFPTFFRDNPSDRLKADPKSMDESCSNSWLGYDESYFELDVLFVVFSHRPGGQDFW